MASTQLTRYVGYITENNYQPHDLSKTVLYSIFGLFSDSEIHEKQFWSQNGHILVTWHFWKFFEGEENVQFLKMVATPRFELGTPAL